MTPSSSDATAVYDTLDTVPEFSALREHLRAGDWQSAESDLEALPPDEAAYTLSLIAEIDGVEDLLEDAVRSAPGSAVARTALAGRSIVLGWRIRSGARAENVSAEQFEGFRAWLVRAEQLLIDACAVRPDYAPAWGMRVLTARALEVGSAEAQRRYDRLRRLSPHDFPGETHMLEYLLPKWAGSDEKARAFAVERASDAPPGSHSGALVAVYHLERWLELDGGEPGAAYLSQQPVVDELTDAAARSVLHEDYVAGPIGVQARSAFAMAFVLGRQHDRAAELFALLDGRATEFPWSYTFDDPAGLTTVRSQVLGARGERR